MHAVRKGVRCQGSRVLGKSLCKSAPKWEDSLDNIFLIKVTKGLEISTYHLYKAFLKLLQFAVYIYGWYLFL